MADISRREIQQIVSRISQLEGRLKRLEDEGAAHERRLKPENLLRAVRHEEEVDKAKGAQLMPAEALEQILPKADRPAEAQPPEPEPVAGQDLPPASDAPWWLGPKE